MANSRSFSAAPTAAAPAGAPPVPGRARLRAVAPDEPGAPVRIPVPAPDLLPPGATWLPAPPHALPTLPGQPPMVGYLLLVPAGQEQATQERAGQGPGAPEAVPPGPVTIDAVRRAAEVEGRPLDLTYLEFELLAHLVAHPHRVHTRDQLVTTVWGYGHVGDGRTVDVHVARLRRKLGAEHRRTIQTVRRVGYKYVPPAPR
ncbi:winged helix-turn-helix domain-containing protein [Streptomyces sp. NPDC050703]|uniref:winged helix-turn-helix domain-containing protein n=1 Tax=Streptomyces sp. NPDC050703 TaxID=3157218 RepID=UPI0034251538